MLGFLILEYVQSFLGCLRMALGFVLRVKCAASIWLTFGLRRMALE